MSRDAFEQLQLKLADEGVDAVFETLASELTSEKKFHELFDVLLMRSRQRLGLPVALSTPIDDLAEPLRSQVEEAYLAACREVGAMLLDDSLQSGAPPGRLREAWMYLRPVGDKRLVAAALAKIEPSEENMQDLIEIGLHEGVAPALGYKLVLDHYGTCNAITTFEGVVLARPRAEQQSCAAALVQHVYAELLANLRADIARQEGRQPPEESLAALVADRDWLFGELNYHIDTTHLAATVRFARLLDDPEQLRLAYELTEYGRRLHEQFQFAGEPPFDDVYPAHGRFFAAQLGQAVDEAVDYFGTRAKQADVHEVGTGPAEVYVALLARLKRYDEALRAAIELFPPGVRTSGFAPNLLELAREAGDFEPLMELCRQRGDLVSFTAALVERSQKCVDGIQAQSCRSGRCHWALGGLFFRRFVRSWLLLGWE